jgi:enoyl-CoA hydratase
MTPEELPRFALFGHETVCKLERLPQIVIAAIEGHAMGGGLEMALACDFRFMARGPARLAVPEVNIGAVPNMGGTQRLPRLIGKSHALEMLITGRQVDADKALAMGLVDQVYEPQELLPKTVEFAQELAQGPTLTIAMIKKCVNEGLEAPLSAGLALERETGRVFPRTEDFQEGVKAFVEKRSPNFQGK